MMGSRTPALKKAHKMRTTGIGKRKMAHGTLARQRKNSDVGVAKRWPPGIEERKKIRYRFVATLRYLGLSLILDLQWARERREAEREREGDFGPDDYLEGTLRGANREDGEIDEFGETVVLVLLCLVISILLYIRTRIVERMRRDQREQGQAGDQQGRPNVNGGVFPPPGDPARADWAILR